MYLWFLMHSQLADFRDRGLAQQNICGNPIFISTFYLSIIVVICPLSIAHFDDHQTRTPYINFFWQILKRKKITHDNEDYFKTLSSIIYINNASKFCGEWPIFTKFITQEVKKTPMEIDNHKNIIFLSW